MSVRVSLLVYDLLPPSKLGTMLNLLGTGVYHTSIELDYGDGTPALEYAFGAHDLKGFTGIFSVQAGTAPSRMPGLRGPPFHRLELGSAFQGRDWTRAKEQQRKEMREHKEQQRAARRSGGTGARDSSSRTTLYTLGSIGSGNGDQGKSTQATASSSASVNSSSTALKGQDEAPGGPSSPSGSGERASLAPELYQEQDDDDDDVEEESDGDGDEIESGMERLSPDARRAWRLVARFKRDPKWHGTAYRLLERNCNHFTSELCLALTGKRPPAWTNRAAWVALSVPCLVPAGFIDDVDESANAQDSLASETDTLVIAPPRADRMDVTR